MAKNTPSKAAIAVAKAAAAVHPPGNDRKHAKGRVARLEGYRAADKAREAADKEAKKPWWK